MTKNDLIDTVAADTGITKAQAGDAVDATIQAITGALSSGDDVTLPGFGKFSVSERGARQGRNPQTGETIQIKASKSPKFSAGARLKAAVN